MSNKPTSYEYESRDEYLDIQIERSQRKFEYCKVYYSDIFRYRQMLKWDNPNWQPKRILTLGVRYGAEVDMFRSVFFSPIMKTNFVQKIIERADHTVLAKDKIGLSKKWGKFAGAKSDGRSVGVELNPAAKRDDVWIGSFDDLPDDWSNQFDLLYSNSFDHSMNPEKVVAEWRRVAAPGAYVITGFSLGQAVSDHDPVGGLTFQTIENIWQLPIVFASQTYNKNNYYEICFRIDK